MTSISTSKCWTISDCNHWLSSILMLKWTSSLLC